MYPNLEAELSRYHISPEDVLGALGISKKTLNNKRAGRTDWTYKEVLAIRQLFPDNANISIEYLFETEGDPPAQAG